MRKKVQFIQKRKIGVKQFRVGQKAVIQGGLADVLEAQGVLVILESIKAEVAAKEQEAAKEQVEKEEEGAAKAEKPTKKTKD